MPTKSGEYGHSDITKRRVFRFLDTGGSISAAARQYNVSRKTIYEWKANRPGMEKKLDARSERIARFNDTLPPPLFDKELSKEARRALDDFAYWRLRYLGRRSTPWQEIAAQQVIDWVYSDQTELVVINCPPGSGKSTLFTR